MDEQALKDLLARQAIREAINRYCRGEDRLDAQLSLSLWHPDGTATYGIKGEFFNGPVTGWAERSHTVLRQWTGSSHQVTNLIIEVDGARAVSEAYVTARIWRMSKESTIQQRVTVGRYLDRWSCRNGVWAVDHRNFVFDLSYASTPTRERDPDWFEGKRGREDPSYGVLGSLKK